MNMEAKKSKLFIWGIFPKCPLYKPVPVLIIIIFIALGTWGIFYLNLWVALAYAIYSVLWYFLFMPVVHCQHCYFKVKDTSLNNKSEDATEKLIPLDKWKESYLKQHVALGKRMSILMFAPWFLPIILIVVSFFLNFNVLALVSLICFIAVLVINWFYMQRKVCATCPIKEECHSSF